ncbi:sodium-solute symporter putative [Vibrio variabilis]|uniref:Sodium-solute symporter putative n=1 Tax=Vibrio variabilis TaxID=990271 RepID=A0ABQ0JI56_9VIBR|nr:sodium-solute symporter putative [Vibrio variabilis]
MPVGMVGLLIAAMFAATMSSMDSGLNRNSGIFVMNFYQPILRPNATERELMFVSKATSTMFGLVIILIALFINSLKGLSLFDTMMYVGALISFPMTILHSAVSSSRKRLTGLAGARYWLVPLSLILLAL